MLAIQTKDITKRFARSSGYRDLLPFRKKQWVMAVEGISLEIEEGEFFGLLGPNGAGKTTLIKMLCCLVLPNSGSARVFGHDVVKEDAAVKRLVGLVSSEERSFYWRLSGRENLRFYAALYHIPRPRALARIDELLDLVGLSDKADIRFQNYSTGMRQKLAIARGLLSEPRLLFVDEPTRSLDPISARAVRAFLKEKVAGEKTTVILATHNLTEAEQLCDRLVIMNRGKISALGSVKELRSYFQKKEKCELQVRNFSEGVMAQLRNVEGVLECSVTGQRDGVAGVRMMISKRSSVLPRVLELMVTNGAEVCDCQLAELPLEEIFTYALDAGDKESR